MKQLTKLLITITLLTFAGCDNLFSPPAFKESGAGLNVTVSNGGESGRTLLPSATFSKYELELTGPQGQNKTETITSGNSVTIDGLTLGTWTISAKGYVNIGGTLYEAASGTDTVNIAAAGGAYNKTVHISAQTGPGSGHLSYAVNYPAGKVNSGEFTYRNLSTNSSVTVPINSPGQSGRVQLAAGYYLVTARLQNNYEIATRTEVAHIYPNMETTALFNFIDNDFTHLITLSGTVNVTINGQSPEEVVIQINRNDTGGFIGEVYVNNGPWSISIPAFSADTSLGFSAWYYFGGSWDHVGNQNRVVRNTNVSGINFSGNFVLPIGEPITITYDAFGWMGGGVPVTPGAGVSGTPIGAAALPDLSAYNTPTQIFVGWATTPTGTPIDGTFVPYSNITLYVVYYAQALMVTVTFDLNYEGGSATWYTKVVEEGTEIGTLPVPNRFGYVFLGWWNTSYTIRCTETFRPLVDMTMYARWALDTMTGDDADELLYLQNGAHAVYAFEIPPGHTLGEYETLTVDYKITPGGAAAWNEYGIRYARLYGVYTDTTPITIASNSEDPYNQPEVLYFNLNGRDEHPDNGGSNMLNQAYILDNSHYSSVLIDRVADAALNDEWTNVLYDLSGAAKRAEDYNDRNLPGAQTGTVYFAIGLACQSIRQYPNGQFIQLVKDIKLLPKASSSAPAIGGTKPPADKAQFLCYEDPIVLEWRAEPTQYNIDNWRDLVPYVPDFSFDRGPTPADEDLRQVVLGDFTYINRGNPNNQWGWLSFGEAGRAIDQSYTGSGSSIAYNNFKNAWYLVLETNVAPTGQIQLVWMGDASIWMYNPVTGSDGEAIYGISEITGDDTEGYIIKLFLPEALAQYGRYFNDNYEWAGLVLQYWGNGDGTNLNNLDITNAYLLVHKDEVEGHATGISLILNFTLTDVSEGGALIDNAAMNKDGDIVVSAVYGLSDYRWYVNGVKNGATGNTLTISPAANCTVTLQAKRYGKWVSQAAIINY